MAPMNRQDLRRNLTAARTLEEMRRIAFFDFGTLFDAKGNLQPIKNLPVDVVDWEKLAARLASARQRKVEEP